MPKLNSNIVDQLNYLDASSIAESVADVIYKNPYTVGNCNYNIAIKISNGDVSIIDSSDYCYGDFIYINGGNFIFDLLKCEDFFVADVCYDAVCDAIQNFKNTNIPNWLLDGVKNVDLYTWSEC